MQPDGAFTIGGMVTSGDELIFPVSFRTVRFPLIINDHDPSIPIWSVNLDRQTIHFNNMCFYTSVTFSMSARIHVYSRGVQYVFVSSRAKIVSYPDPRHSSGWIISPLRGSRVWRISRQNRGSRRSILNGTIGLQACAISDFN